MEFGAALRQLWPKGNARIPGLLDGIIKSAPGVFARHGITDKTVLAHIMAQISHECGAGLEVVENLNYSADRMQDVWPSRFKSDGDAAPYAHKPRELANKVYNGRMGNRVGSDDGWTYRGRGATQTTGRDGYDRLGKAMGMDFLSAPDRVNAPDLFLACGVQDFINCGCMPFAKADDLINVTKRLNGGTVGVDDRRAWLKRWKALDVAVPVGVPVDMPPVIKPDPVPAPKPVSPAPKSNWLVALIKAVLTWKR